MSNTQNLERGKKVFESIFTSNTECLRNFIEREDIVLPEDKYGPQGQQNHLGIRFTQAAKKKDVWYKQLGDVINELYSPVPEDLKLLIDLLSNPDNRTEQNVNLLIRNIQNYNKNSGGSCSEAPVVPVVPDPAAVPVVPDPAAVPVVPAVPDPAAVPVVPAAVPAADPAAVPAEGVGSGGNEPGGDTTPKYKRVDRNRNPGFWGPKDLAKK